MYLYEKRENEICIYELVSDDEKLRKFREDELKTQENIFWCTDTLKQETPSFARAKEEKWKNITVPRSNLFENITNTICINQKDLNPSIGGDRLTPDDFNSTLFKDYCIGKYDLSPIVKIIENITSYSPEDQKLLDDYEAELKNYRKNYPIQETMKRKFERIAEPKAPTRPNVKEVVSTNIIQYLVPTEKNYNRVNEFRLRMNNIISIPKSLYLLNMFLQGNIDEIAKENIDTQLKFFSLNPKPILTVSLEYLEKLIQCNLVKYNFDNVDTLFDSHQKILKKLK